MSRIELKFSLGDIEVDAVLEEGVNAFPSATSIGKTRAFEAIWTYCQASDLTCVYISYLNYENFMWEKVKGFDIVILDDADLYIEDIDYDKIVESNRIILLDAKQTIHSMYKGVHQRQIEMKEDKVVIR